MTAPWDYIVVGAGSAGCVLAARLSEDPGCRVLLLEAGGHDRSLSIHVPGLMSNAIASRELNWHYAGAPDASLASRHLVWAGGRVLGGSSSINGMVFVRGLPNDFDAWAATNPGWDWASMLPMFRRMETWTGTPHTTRGADGPLHVRPHEQPDATCAAWLRAAGVLGTPDVGDYNTGIVHGAGFTQASQYNGRRHSAARAYLVPALSRANLALRTGAHVLRLKLGAQRCVGVEYLRNGCIEQAAATREVLVCAGAIGSPALLLRSGVGPADALRRLGIPARHDLPGVGRNLCEHVNVKLSVRVLGRSYSSEKRGWRRLRNAARWALTRRGPAGSCVGHVQAFMKTDSALPHADIQVQTMPVGFGVAWDAPYDSISSVVSLCHPRVRGAIELVNGDPLTPPRIAIELLSQPDDVAALIRACRLVRATYAATPVRARWLAEVEPGPAVRSDADWLQFLRATAALNWHPAGTCRMGSDSDAVVGADLRVRGLAGLRVVDASVMPSLTSGNTNAPVIAIAEKAASMC